ncbi:hypothetical protein [Alteromonas lipotrueae]|uniref:hypothetical protein n=1 Tax=Alteromonas lipotrueae TaxID=2803814 RepID=UPI000A580F11|nr:hypothetical protein [Alteromonas lipotrueae]
MKFAVLLLVKIAQAQINDFLLSNIITTAKASVSLNIDRRSCTLKYQITSKS